MSRPMSMKFAADYYTKRTPWMDYADWQAKYLFPLTEKLMSHRNQPYSDNQLLAMKQACIRLSIKPEFEVYANACLAEVINAIAINSMREVR